jgi:hypothetical protein
MRVVTWPGEGLSLGAGRGEVSMIPAKHHKLPDINPIRRLRPPRELLEPHHLMKLLPQPQFGVGNKTAPGSE